MPALDFTSFQARTTATPPAASPSSSPPASRTTREPFERLVDRLVESPADDGGTPHLAARPRRDAAKSLHREQDELHESKPDEASGDMSSTGAATTSSVAIYPWTLPLNPAVWQIGTNDEQTENGEDSAGSVDGDGIIDALSATPDALAGAADANAVADPSTPLVPPTPASSDAGAFDTAGSSAASGTAAAVLAAGSSEPFAPAVSGVSSSSEAVATGIGGAGAAADAATITQSANRPTGTAADVQAMSDARQVARAHDANAPGAGADAAYLKDAAAMTQSSSAADVAVLDAASDLASVRTGQEASDAGRTSTNEGSGAGQNASTPAPGAVKTDDRAKRHAVRELLRAIDATGAGTSGAAGAVDASGASRAGNASSNGFDAGRPGAGADGTVPAAVGADALAAQARHETTRGGSSSSGGAGSSLGVESSGAGSSVTSIAANVDSFGAGAGSAGDADGGSSGGGVAHDARSSRVELPGARSGADLAGTTGAADFRALAAALAGQGAGDASRLGATDPLAGAGPTDAPIETGAPAADQAAQIVRSLRFQWRGPVGEAQLRLRPEHLGQVLVSVRVEQGTVSATLHAETAAARQWIQGHQQQLRDALDAQGLRVGQLHVTSDPDDRPRRDRPQHEQPDAQPRAKRREADADGAPRFEIRI